MLKNKNNKNISKGVPQQHRWKIFYVSDGYFTYFAITF